MFGKPRLFLDPLPYNVSMSPREMRQVHFLLTAGFDSGARAWVYIKRLEKLELEQDLPELRSGQVVLDAHAP
jgi:hypothetical protein